MCPENGFYCEESRRSVPSLFCVQWSSWTYWHSTILRQFCDRLFLRAFPKRKTYSASELTFRYATVTPVFPCCILWDTKTAAQSIQRNNYPTMESQPNAGKCTRSHSATADEFEQLGMAMMHQKSGGSLQTRDRRFRSHFGVTPEICAHVWDLLDPSMMSDEMYL